MDTPYQTFNTTDDCQITYSLRGAAKAMRPRLVLIHSLGLDASIWDNVIENLGDYSQILTYDCRGHGRSGKPHMPFSVELFARDLAELLDHVDWRTAVVSGCSMGGCVAQAFGGLYASRASGIALIDTTSWYGEDAPRTWRKRATNARSNGLGSMIDFQMTRWFGDRFRSSHTELLKKVTEVFLGNDLDCYVASCEMLGDADLRPYLQSLRNPVAIVVGEEDYATPVAASLQLHHAIPQSTLTIIPGGRHLTPLEYPEQIASELRGLFERIWPQ